MVNSEKEKCIFHLGIINSFSFLDTNSRLKCVEPELKK